MNNCGQTDERIKVSSFIKHKGYDPDSDIRSHDLALVKLEEQSSIDPVKIDPGIFSPTYTEGKYMKENTRVVPFGNFPSIRFLKS